MSSVIIPIVAAIIGASGGWIAAYLTLRGQRLQAQREARQAEREAEARKAELEAARREAAAKEARDYLTGFLEPLKVQLSNSAYWSEQLFCHLRRLGYPHLEDHPSKYEWIFSQLEDRENDDCDKSAYWMKHNWKLCIATLQENNRTAVKLIDANANLSNISREDLRQACEEFKTHAQTWEIAWTGMQGLPVEKSPVADRFPAEIIPALDEEIREVRQRAGLAE